MLLPNRPGIILKEKKETKRAADKKNEELCKNPFSKKFIPDMISLSLCKN